MRRREPISHVIILDGTMSTLVPGYETHAGQALRLCCEMGSKVSVYYESGVQWESWKSLLDVLMGRGINRQIRRAYGYLASRYNPGDKIFFFGYSRGAYRVRSLAGAIDAIGLLKAEHATVRNIKQAYRHYECNARGEAAAIFRQKFCHENVAIEMVGVWDTVKALGLHLPLPWHRAEDRYAFHNHRLGPVTRHGYHAMALDETRELYEPILWECTPEFKGHVEQVWFRGTHGDVGGQLNGFEEARPLSNISLIWMLDKAELHGLALPDGWRDRFPTDPHARSVGTWRGWGKIFLLRKQGKWGRIDPKGCMSRYRRMNYPGGCRCWISPRIQNGSMKRRVWNRQWLTPRRTGPYQVSDSLSLSFRPENCSEIRTDKSEKEGGEQPPSSIKGLCILYR